MITIISGSGRGENNTRKVAHEYHRLLTEKGVAAQVMALDELNVFTRDAGFEQIEARFLKTAEKFIIVMPEYNGSYPGILKLMIDNTDVAKVWWHKKVLLVGVSTGRAGNLRGMEHLTGSLLHLKMNVHHNRLPISIVNKLIGAENQLTDALTLQAIDVQLEEFLNY